jgi:hypothetical protein
MTRKPSMSAVAITRRERAALRREIARVCDVARQGLRQALAEGLLRPDDLPIDVAQRLLAQEGRGLEGYVEGDRIIVEGEDGKVDG